VICPSAQGRQGAAHWHDGQWRGDELVDWVGGGRASWYVDNDAKPPPMTFDPAGKRFAIVNGDTITRIEFDHSALSSGQLT
jgi:hypothetical protein